MLQDNVIDSRDIQDLIDELQAERDALEDNPEKLLEWKEANEDELSELLSVREQGQSVTTEWEFGEALIRESYWVEYVQELLADIGDLPKDLPVYIAIDWEQTAKNIRVDYSEITFNGETYLIRTS